MHRAVTILLAGLAFWCAVIDWRATIGVGYAYRFGTLADLLVRSWPEGSARLGAALARGGLGWAWDPVGAFVLSLPVAPVLAAIAALVWIARPQSRARARW